MTLPKKINSHFIGKLKALEAESKRSNRVAWHHLSRAVKQCRTYNTSNDPQHRAQLWQGMARTQKELAQLGIVVG